MTSENLPELYHNNSSIQQFENSELLKILFIPVGAKVLDLGCGTGLMTTALSEIVGPTGNIVAVDPDVTRIEFATKENARSNIEYLVADDQSFPGDEYDFIILANVIHWIENKAALFERISSKLKVNGTFAFITLDGKKGLHLGPIRRKAIAELFAPNYEETVIFKQWTLMDESQYRECAKNFQFQVCSSKVITTESFWPTLDSYIDFVAGIFPGTIDKSAINAQTLRRFKETSEEALSREPVITDVLLMVLNKTK